MSGSEEHFSLQWNNFHSNLSEGFHSLLKAEDLVDVTLAADNKYVQAHRLVLSVCSPYFKDLFKVNPCKHPTIILKGVGFQELMDILEFMYRGQVNVQQNSLTEFLKTAEMLQVKGLCEDSACVKPEPVSTSSSPTSPATAPVTKVLVPCVTKKPKLKSRMCAQSDEVSPPPVKRKRPAPPVKGTSMSAQEDEEPIVVSKPYDDDTSDEVEFVDIIKPKVESLEDEESNIEELEMTENAESSFSNIFNENVDFPMQNSSDSQFESDFPCSSQTVVGVQGGDQGSLTLLRSLKGKQQLVYNGYLFGIDRAGTDRYFWKCSDYHKTKCKARLVTVGTVILVKYSQHNHEAHWDKIEKKKQQQEALSHLISVVGNTKEDLWE